MWMKLRLLLVLTVAAATLVGCPRARRGGGGGGDDDGASEDDDDVANDDDGSDDDDLGDDDDVVSPESPTVTNVDVCEEPVNTAICTEPAWSAGFSVTVEDDECDLHNPGWMLQIEGDSQITGTLEGSLDCGGTLRLSICSETWVRGATIEFEVRMTDEAGNQSGPFQDEWTVPQPGEDDCGPV